MKTVLTCFQEQNSIETLKYEKKFSHLFTSWKTAFSFIHHESRDGFEAFWRHPWGFLDLSHREVSRKCIVSVAFEEEELAWLMEQLKKAVELEGSLGFIRKFRGKLRTHLLDICFNSRGRFIRITKFFVTNRKTKTLVVPEDVKGREWEAPRKTISWILECSFHPFNGSKDVKAKMENKARLGWC